MLAAGSPSPNGLDHLPRRFTTRRFLDICRGSVFDRIAKTRSKLRNDGKGESALDAFPPLNDIIPQISKRLFDGLPICNGDLDSKFERIHKACFQGFPAIFDALDNGGPVRKINAKCRLEILLNPRPDGVLPTIGNGIPGNGKNALEHFSSIHQQISGGFCNVFCGIPRRFSKPLYQRINIGVPV